VVGGGLSSFSDHYLNSKLIRNVIYAKENVVLELLAEAEYVELPLFRCGDTEIVQI
jgi:hypothetical protein